jgi:hypothetical protein
MIGQLITATLAAVILAAVAVSIPDIKRYLAIRAM